MRNMRRTFVTFLVLAICQASCLVTDEDDDEMEPTVLSYRLPAGIVKPLHYKLHLNPDLEEYTFDGEVVITLLALTDNDTLTLNSKDLIIQRIVFKDLNTTKTFTFEPVLYVQQEILIIKLDRPFQKDHHLSLTIQFLGVLNIQDKGFYTSRITEDGKVVGYVAVTHFEPTSARLAFPCWDEPIYKATFSLSLTHKLGRMAISNTRAESEKYISNDTLITSFKKTRLMATYLLAFAVGDYIPNVDRAKKMMYRVWSKPAVLQQTDYALEIGRKVIEEMNKYTCILYHISMNDKIDQVPLEDFAPGAMENWGLVTYRAESLLYDKNNSQTREKMDVLTLITHEFSHQWFGDLITPKWWTYLWLNEGFANYLQYFIGNKIVPELRLDHVFVVESMQAKALVDDAILTVAPLNQNVDKPDDITDLFGSITYNKGSSVIRMIAHAMTEEVFRDGLRRYLDDNMYGNVDSDDFFESLQKALDRSRNPKWKVPVKQAMHEWVEKPGYPVILAQRVKEGYRLLQDHFVIEMIQLYELSTKWWIPITYVEESNPNFTNTAPVDWYEPTIESHLIKTEPKTGWFIFNTQQTGYYRVTYDVENWKLLTEELKKGKDTKIHVLNRAQLLDDVLNIPLINRLHYAVALNLTLFLRHETDYIVWQPAFRHLRFLRNWLRTSEQYYTFKRYVVYLMDGLIKHLGFEPRANDTDLEKMLRVTAMSWACEFGVKSCISYAEREYNRWLENPQTRLDNDLKAEIICAGVRNANESVWQMTKKHLLKEAEGQSSAALEDMLSPLACSNSTSILKEYLRSASRIQSPINYHSAVTQVVHKHVNGPDIAFNLTIEEYKNFELLLRGKEIVEVVQYFISEGVMDMQLYLDMSALLVDRQLLDLLIDTMTVATKNMMWVQRHRPKVERWLAVNSKLFEDDGHNSASSMRIGLCLVIFSLFITRFY